MDPWAVLGYYRAICRALGMCGLGANHSCFDQFFWAARSGEASFSFDSLSLPLATIPSL